MNDELLADLRPMAEKIVTQEQAQIINRLSPEERGRFLDAAVQGLSKLISEHAEKRRAK